MTTDSTLGAYVRGRLHLAGIGPGTDVATTCDVVTVAVMEAPIERLTAWKRQLDALTRRAQAATGTGPDRETWGLLPEHQASMARLVEQTGRV